MNKYLYAIVSLFIICSCNDDIVDSGSNLEYVEDMQEVKTRVLSKNKIYVEPVGLLSSTDLLDLQGKIKLKMTFDFESCSDLYWNMHTVEVVLEEEKSGKSHCLEILSGTVGVNVSKKDFEKEFTLTKGGRFYVRVKAKFNGGRPPYISSMESEKRLIEIKYPDKNDIIASCGHWFDHNMKMTIGDFRERGFYIYMIDGKRIQYGETCVSNAQSTSPILPNYITGSESHPQTNPNTPGAKYIIGLFHTHPPLSNLPPKYYRECGPSAIDKAYLKDFPGFVYDYAAPIRGGHDRFKDPIHLYTYGPNSRNL